MKHCILVKWKDPEAAKPRYPAIQSLFAAVKDIPGVSEVELIENCVARSNRYDLLIRITMEEASLPEYDASAAHKRWKAEYGAYIETKAIFDYE